MSPTTYLQICILVFVYLLLVAAFVVGSAFFYAYQAVWISPVPMAIGMAFEALVVGSVHASLDLKDRRDASGRKTAADGGQGDASARKTSGEGGKGLSKWQQFLTRLRLRPTSDMGAFAAVGAAV